jgi:hypothetical protein
VENIFLRKGVGVKGGGRGWGWGKREGERDGEGVGEGVEIIFGFILVTFTTTRNSCKMKQLYFYPKIYLAAK